MHRSIVVVRSLYVIDDLIKNKINKIPLGVDYNFISIMKGEAKLHLLIGMWEV